MTSNSFLCFHDGNIVESDPTTGEVTYQYGAKAENVVFPLLEAKSGVYQGQIRHIVEYDRIRGIVLDNGAVVSWSELSDTKANRHNTGKHRHSLIPPFAIKNLAAVLTRGSEEYGDHNWKKGMPWTSVVDSLMRHLNAFVSGEDNDPKSGELHVAHIMANAAFLTEYYDIFPQGDDRWRKPKLRVAIDIYEVLADFIPAYCDYFGLSVPEVWNFDSLMNHRLLDLPKEFWINLPCKIIPSDIPFEPVAYITARVIDPEWTLEWLNKCGYPLAPLYSTPDKVVAFAHCGADVFIDDSIEVFMKFKAAGYDCYLMDAPHNRRYDVGHKRIKDLQRFK